MKSTAEEIRLRHLYRKLIVMGKARVSLESARRLVGPDCAFHLYGTVTGKKKRGGRSRLLPGTASPGSRRGPGYEGGEV